MTAKQNGPLEAINLEYLCHNAQAIARQAGQKILEVYNSEYAIEHKDDNTPLTTADLAADSVIRNALKELTPEIPILTEESEAPPYQERTSWARYWLVDPLDGTREFIKRNGEFTVNIALIEYQRSILGAIHAPVLKTDYFAWQGGGAYKREQNQPPQPIHVRQATPGALVIAGSRSHASEKLQGFLGSIEDEHGEIELLSVGSSLKSCMVAEGSVDLYARLGLTSEWDTAAAQCIVEEAGGFMTQTSGLPMRYNTKDSLLNPEFLVFGDNTINWREFI